MASKNATPPDHASHDPADHIPPAMDYAQHEATYNGFLTATKWAVIAMAFVVVALYCFIEAGQPILGTVILLLIPIGGIAVAVMGSRKS